MNSKIFKILVGFFLLIQLMLINLIKVNSQNTPSDVGSNGTDTDIAGTSRGDICEVNNDSNPNIPLTFLLPFNQDKEAFEGKTIYKNFTFWFYVPTETTEENLGNFYLFDLKNSKTIY